MAFVTGNFLFIHYGFGGDKLQPSLTLHAPAAETLHYFEPRGQTLTLTFDTTQHYCTGWHDLATGESFPCPDAAELPAAYSQCMHCQRKTGFNPAFYNATSVSEQQQARNAQPHFLYLAHFAPGVVKVGISWSQRGLRRLLDQGARSCLIIKDYPTATVARQYEARAVKLPGLAETLQAKAKYAMLGRPYDAAAGMAELLAVRERLHNELDIKPDNNQPTALDTHYLGEHTFIPNELVQLTENKISGRCLGLFGSAFFAEQNGTPYFLSLNSLPGYHVTIAATEQPNAHQPQQASLF